PPAMFSPLPGLAPVMAGAAALAAGAARKPPIATASASRKHRKEKGLEEKRSKSAKGMGDEGLTFMAFCGVVVFLLRTVVTTVFPFRERRATQNTMKARTRQTMLWRNGSA
ncbi:MAG: hypothetical protein FWC42_11210, partial [Proteobacteria bacterium]|nr:hypothetical protein [Pseudomonadota bacterium]